MKVIVSLVVALYLSACMNVNTIENVKSKNTKFEVESTLSSEQIESKIYDYLSKCFKTSVVKLNGNKLGETINVQKFKKNDETDIVVKNILYKGPHHFLIVNIKNNNDNVKLTSYAATARGESAFPKIIDIANGTNPEKCPGDIF